MQKYVSNSTKNVIFLGHVTEGSSDDGSSSIRVPIKGAMKNLGVESFFTTVVSAKAVPLIELEDYSNKLLNITEDDKDREVKYVFQTYLTKKTTDERIRAPLNMWEKKELYIDNDAQLVLDRLTEYYTPKSKTKTKK